MGRAWTQRKSDMRVVTKFPKNNRFCYRWRVVDNFNKSIERDMFEQHLNGGSYYKSLQNEHILALYKMTYTRRKNDFISQLTQDAMSFLTDRRTALSQAVREETFYTKSMASIVDHLFNVLLSCSIEMNTVLGFSELFIAATEPEVQTYTSNGESKIRSLYCRFSTSIFSIVIYGHKNRVEMYVVPIEDLFGNKELAGGHEPIALCIATLDGEKVNWSSHVVQIESSSPYDQRKEQVVAPLTEETMEGLCHLVLRELIEKTQQVLAKQSPSNV